MPLQLRWPGGDVKGRGPVERPAVSRRAVLGAGALAALGLGGSLAGCSPLIPGGGLRPDGTVRVSHYLTPSYTDLEPSIAQFAKNVDARLGEGAADVYGAGTLLNSDQTLNGLLRAVADVAMQTSSFVSTSFPILGAIELPFSGADYPTLKEAVSPHSDLRKTFNAEFAKKGVMSVGTIMCPTEWIYTVNRPVTKPEDIRGLRIRVSGHVEGAMLKALGAAPVALSSAEVYEALERGTVDGMVSYPGTVVSRSLQDVLRYATIGHFGAYTYDAYANLDWFNSVPQEVREAVHDSGRVFSVDGTKLAKDVQDDEYMPVFESSGIELIELDKSQTRQFRNATKWVEDWWRSKVGDDDLADRALKQVRNP